LGPSDLGLGLQATPAGPSLFAQPRSGTPCPQLRNLHARYDRMQASEKTNNAITSRVSA